MSERTRPVEVVEALEVAHGKCRRLIAQAETDADAAAWRAVLGAIEGVLPETMRIRGRVNGLLPDDDEEDQLTSFDIAHEAKMMADAFANDGMVIGQVAHKLAKMIWALAKIDSQSEPLSCGCAAGSHPPRHNYLHGEAERYGKVCSLGWPLEER